MTALNCTNLFALFAVMILLRVPLDAQQVSLKYYTPIDGLNSNRILGVTQDAQGFIWVVSNGLNRFDGQKFLNYSNQPEQIFRRREVPMTIVTMGDHLYFLSDSALHTFNTSLGIFASYPLRGIVPAGFMVNPERIRLSGEHSLIFPAFDQERTKSVFIRFLNDSLSHFLDVGYSYADYVDWAVGYCGDTQGNLYLINQASDSLFQVSPDGKVRRRLALLRSEAYARLYAAGDRIIVLQDGSVYTYDTDDEALQPHPINKHLNLTDNPLLGALQTPRGDLWLSGHDRLLLYYDETSDTLYNLSDEVKKVITHRERLQDIYMDQTGVLWIGTISGLLKVSWTRDFFDTYFTGQRDVCEGYCSFRGIAEDSDGSIYASYYLNVFRISKYGREQDMPILPQNNTPFDLLADAGKLFLNDGSIFDLKTGEYGNPYNATPLPYPVDDGVLASAGDGRVWRAIRENLFYLNKNSPSPSWVSVLSLPDRDYMTDIQFDPSENAVWLATQFVLRKYDTRSGAVTQYDSTTISTPWTGIRYVYPDGRGLVWLGTEEGLVRFDPSSKIVKPFTVENGLPHNYVVGILPEGDSALWLSTHNGLSRLSIGSQSFVNFYESDGIAYNEFNRMSVCKASNGRYYFGGIHGVTAFTPKEVMSNYREHFRVGKLAFTSVSISDEKINSPNTLVFNTAHPVIDIYYRNKTLQFEYTLNDFNQNASTLFSYQLAGYTDVWTKPSVNTTASFNALPKGRYTLKIRALDRRGRWINDELQATLIVHPPWWATWWAYAIYAVIVAGIAYGIMLFMKRRLKLQHALQMEKLEAQRLKELDAFKSRLYTNLTHEFRTPLTVILGMARQILSAPQQGIDKAAKLIENNGQNLLRLVNQLLDLSKLENKTFKLDMHQDDIVSFLRYVTESFQTYANGRNLSLRFTSAVETLIMDFDPEQLQQVMSNLLSNAIKFTPSGGDIVVRISKSREDLMIEVKDSGIGISKEHLPHIFDRFFQVDGSTTRPGEGTGIGLAHAQELVRLMDGEIHAESELRKGTTFYVKLPVRNTAPHAAYPLKRPEKMLTGIPLTLTNEIESEAESMIADGKPELLIVEDSPDVVIYLRSCLEDKFHLDIAYNGRIGIEKAIENVPDLIISDVMMPEKDGFELCEILKNDERTSHIPIVLLTAKADAASRIAGLKRGADAYLAKPFDKEELRIRLEKLNELRVRLRERYEGQAIITRDGHKDVSADRQPAMEEYQIEDAFIQKVRQVIEHEIGNTDFNPVRLSRDLGLSQSQLYRKMKALTGTTPALFIRGIRLKRGKDLLKSTGMTVSEVAYEVGFSDPSYFSRSFSETFGSPPNENRK